MEITKEEGRIILGLISKTAESRVLTLEEVDLMARIIYQDKELSDLFRQMRMQQSMGELNDSINHLIKQGIINPTKL